MLRLVLLAVVLSAAAGCAAAENVGGILAGPEVAPVPTADGTGGVGAVPSAPAGIPGTDPSVPAGIPGTVPSTGPPPAGGAASPGASRSASPDEAVRRLIQARLADDRAAAALAATPEAVEHMWRIAVPANDVVAPCVTGAEAGRPDYGHVCRQPSGQSTLSYLVRADAAAGFLVAALDLTTAAGPATP